MNAGEMVALLKEVEWTYDTGTDCEWCPCCENDPPKHTDECKLASMIVALEYGQLLLDMQKPAIDADLQAKQDILRVLAKDKNVSVRKSVAGNIYTPLDVLAELAKDKSVGVKSGVASNPSTPQDVLRKLYDTANISVYSLLENPNTPPDIMLKLYEKRDAYGFNDYDFLRQSNTPTEVLDKIMEETGKVSTIIAHPNASIEVLRKSAKSSHLSTRTDVAELAANQPAEILDILATDKSPSVRATLAKTLAPRTNANQTTAPVEVEAPKPIQQPQQEPFKMLTPDDIWCEMAQDKDVSARRSAAYDAPITPRLFELLAKDKSKEVVQALAYREELTPGMLSVLAKHPNEEIREIVAGTSSLSMETFQLLARDTSLKVKLAVAANAAFIKMCDTKSETPAEPTPAPETVKETSTASGLAVFLGMAGATAIGSSIMSAMLSSPSARVQTSIDVEPEILSETIAETAQQVAQ